MPTRRRPLRPTVATLVLVAVIATLAIIVARGPTKFFESRSVQSGATCAMRHCPTMAETPDSRVRQDSSR